MKNHNEIHGWFPKVKNGGYISGHDYAAYGWDGVVRAVDEKFSGQIDTMDGNCWIYKKE